MPFLVGFLDPNRGAFGFLIPLFANRYGANYNLVQDIAPDDRVKAFLEFEGSVNCVSQSTSEVKIGGKAFWAFRYQDRISQGTSEELTTTLLPLLSQRSFSNTPLLESEIARFCGQQDIYYEALLATFKFLKVFSATAAEIWRDTVVLLPVAKSELATILPRDFLAKNPSLADARAWTQEKDLVVELPRRMFSQPTFATGWNELPKTTELAKLFDLQKIVITQSPRPGESQENVAVGMKGAPDTWQVRRDGYMAQSKNKKTVANSTSSPDRGERLSEAERIKNKQNKREKWLEAERIRTSQHKRPASRHTVNPSPSRPVPVIKPPAYILEPAFQFRSECIQLIQRHDWVVRTQAENLLALIAVREGRIFSFGFAYSSEVLAWTIDTVSHIYPGYTRCILANFYPSEFEVATSKKDNINIRHVSEFESFFNWRATAPS